MKEEREELKFIIHITVAKLNKIEIPQKWKKRISYHIITNSFCIFYTT